MNYGELPVSIGNANIECNEMMFYQYLPIKFPNISNPVYESRLNFLDSIIGKACCDFVGVFGLNRYMESYVYLTTKHLYQKKECSFNRNGYHSDGFMTEDINYIWSNIQPTVFNKTKFNLTQDDVISMSEMEGQAVKTNEVTYPNNELLRLNQYNIHKVNDNIIEGMRTFIKISFSKDKYDLIGNAHNYLLDYKWEMKPRKIERNIPQSVL